MRPPIAAAGAVLFGLAAGVYETTANADEASFYQHAIPAPTHAFELKVETTYTQGFGMIAPRTGVPDVTGAGIAFALAADYRASPWLSFGVQGEYQEFSNELDTAARGTVANAGFTLHATPFVRGDPWLRLAIGYRLLWAVDPPGAPTTLFQGFELLKISFGYDIRLSRGLALSPMAGIDVNLFLWQVQDHVSTALASAQVGSFVSAGALGRFDFGGASVPSSEVAPNFTSWSEPCRSPVEDRPQSLRACR
jgi:hypothetical protein